MKHSPGLPFKVEHVQIVQFICYLVEATKDHHVVTDHVARVPRPSEGNKWMRRVLIDFHLGPLVSAEVEGPEVIQLLIVLVAPSKYIH